MLPKNSTKSNSSKGPTVDPSIGRLVQYEDEGQVILAVVTGTKKDKLIVFNQRGRELDLARNRLYFLPGNELSQLASSSARLQALTEMATAIESEASALSVEEVWTFLHEECKPYTVTEICQTYFGSDTCARHAGLRGALIREKVHFKRDKDAFEPRPAAIVEEIRKAEEAKAKKRALREGALAFLRERVSNREIAIPHEFADAVRLIEEVAALMHHTDPARQKEAREFVHACAEGLRIAESMPLEKRAYEVLLKAGMFHEHTNLAFIRHEIPTRHTDGAITEAHATTLPRSVEEYPEAERSIRRDLTRVRCVTIDDSSTRDMDDALSLERTRDGYEVGIHITDVTVAVPPGSALDRSARRRATSIYCADQTVNMLPEELSERELSLVAGQVRPCLSVLVSVNQNLEVISASLTPSFITVSERYSYDQVDHLLEAGDETLLALHDVAAAYEERRIRQGAVRVHKRDAMPIYQDGQVRLQEIDEDSPARILVSELMVLANSVMAQFAIDNNLPVVFRGQERPDAEPVESVESDAPEGPAKDFSARTKLKKSSISFDPQPHAGLGLRAYIQATSPIRRYMDLCHQRQFVEFFRSGKPWVSRDEFAIIAGELEIYLQEALLASRETKRYWLLRYLEQRGRGEPIEGTVVRVDLRSPLVELDEVYITALVRTRQPLKLGDRVKLTISAVDARSDYLRVG